jgi:aryl-alcohol dehydrogenase-like predicted oxidoreductase
MRPCVFTKASLLDDGSGRVRNSLKLDSILLESEAGLERLEVDAIDLYQIPWPIPDHDIEEGWSELKEQGLVRHIGVTEPQLSRHLATAHRLRTVGERHGVTAGRRGGPDADRSGGAARSPDSGSPTRSIRSWRPRTSS